MPQDRLQYIFDLLKGKNTVSPELKKVNEEALQISKTVAKAGTAAFVAFGTAIGGSVLAASKFEDIGVQFEVLTGNVKDAGKAIDQLKKFSAGTPFQFADIAQAGKQLLGFGFAIEELTPLLNNLGDVAAASGKPIQEISLIFGQVSAAGKLTGERLLQFQERAIPIGPAIAKTMGIAETAVKKAVTEGKVDFATFEKAFASLSEKGGFAFGGLAKLSATLSGKISTLKDNFVIFAGNVGDFFLPVFKDAIDLFTGLIRGISNNKPLVEFIANFLKVGVVVSGVVASIGGMTAALLSAKLAWMGLGIAAGVAGITMKTALIATGVGAVIVGLGVAVAYLAANWEKSVAAMSAVWKAFADYHGQLTDAIEQRFSYAFSIMGEYFKIEVEKIKVRWEKLVTFFSDSGRLISSIMKGAFSLNSSVIKQGFADFEKNTAESFGGAKEKIDKLSEGFENFKKNISDGTSFKSVDFKIDWTNYEKTLAKSTSKGISAGAKNKATSTAISESLTKVFDALPLQLSSGLSKGAAGAKQTFKAVATTAATAFLGPMGAAAGPLLDMLMMSKEQLRETIKAFVGAIPEIIESIIDNIPVIIEALIEALPQLIEGLVRVATKYLTNPMMWNRIMIQLVISFIKAVPAMVTGFVKGFVGGLKNGILDSFSQAFKQLTGFWKKIFKFDGGGKGVVEKFLGFDFPFIKFAGGGKIGGNARVSGDSLKNDTVPALLSPGEVVLPRTVVQGGTVGGVVDFMKAVGAPVKGFGLGSFISDAISDFSGFVGGITGYVSSQVEDVLAAGGSLSNKFLSLVGLGGLTDQLKELLRSLYRIGASVNVYDLIRDPKGTVTEAVKGAKDYFKPNFKRLLSPIGFAEGGIVPGIRGMGDVVPAMLSPGELVVDRSTTDQIRSGVGSESGGGSPVLNQILAALKEPQVVSASIEINREVFANMILELSRTNNRLTA